MAHYFPIIRTKAGEATALRHLGSAARAKITPIINMVAGPKVTFVSSLQQAWPAQAAALDGRFNFTETGSVNGFASMFNAIGNAGVQIMPSVTVHDPQPYVAAVQAAVNASNRGLVVQTTIGSLPGAAAWVAQQGWNLADVDFVITVGDVSAHDPTAYGAYVVHAMNANVVQPNRWRSVSLHAFCAPRDHGNLVQGRNLVSRTDWLLWQHVSQNVGYDLNYSDCGHVHASMEEVPGAAMATATVSVRYAIDDNWIIRKGVRVGGQRGQPMPQQYRGHAQALRAEPQFGGVPGCWADGEITRYAAGGVASGAGGRAQWASIGMNRHLSLVADRLP